MGLFLTCDGKFMRLWMNNAGRIGSCSRTKTDEAGFQDAGGHTRDPQTSLVRTLANHD